MGVRPRHNSIRVSSARSLNDRPAPRVIHPERQRLRGFEEHRIVQQIQRLQRRVRLAAACRRASHPARRNSSAADTAWCAGSGCTGRGGTSRGPDFPPISSAAVAQLRDARGLRRPDARAADIRIQQPAGESASSRISSAGRRRRDCRASSVFSGSLRLQFRPRVRGLPVSRRRHHQPDQRFIAPAAVADTRWPASRAVPDATAYRPAFRNPPRSLTMPRPNNSCQMRFTATRAVSGFSGDISQRARSSRGLAGLSERRQKRRNAGLHFIARILVIAPQRECVPGRNRIGPPSRTPGSGPGKILSSSSSLSFALLSASRRAPCRADPRSRQVHEARRQRSRLRSLSVLRSRAQNAVRMVRSRHDLGDLEIPIEQFAGIVHRPRACPASHCFCSSGILYCSAAPARLRSYSGRARRYEPISPGSGASISVSSAALK